MLETLYICSVFLFANSQHLSTHVSACPSMSQDHAAVFAWGFPHPCLFLNCSSRNSGLKHFFIFLNNGCIWFALSLSTSQMNMIKKWCGFIKLNASYLPLFMSSTYTDRNNCCFLWANKHSQFGTIPNSDSTYTSSNCLSHNNPACGCPYKFSQEEQRVFRTGPWLWPFMSWKTYPNIWTFWLWNFEQFWSVFCCVSCLSCTVW